jgi:hypothetical protein
MVSRSLQRALGALLPAQDETWLLQALLADGAAVADSWRQFTDGGRDLAELFRTDRGELRRLGPLLAWNLRRNGVQADPALLTVLRTGMLREQLRSDLYRGILMEALCALDDAHVTFLVLGGADLGMSAYPEPMLRHTHDIDLLMAGRDVECSAGALERVGFRRVPTEDGVVELRHGRDLPVRLNTSLFHLSCHPSSFGQLLEAKRIQDVGGRSARVLSREDALALALGRASYSAKRVTLQWACDAWMIVASGPVDAERLISTLARARLLLPASVLLRYVADLGAPLDARLVEQLEAAAAAGDALDRDLALHGLRHGTPAGLSAVLARISGRVSRLRALGWMLVPSPAYVRWAHHVEHGALVPWYYARRVVRAMQG